jgi:hypothetical protein
MKLTKHRKTTYPRKSFGWFHRFAATGFIGGLTGLQAAATGGSGLGPTVGGAVGTVGAAKGLAGEGSYKGF